MLALSRTLCQFVSFWLTASGLYFLVYNMSCDGKCNLSFFESMYFLIVSSEHPKTYFFDTFLFWIQM